MSNSLQHYGLYPARLLCPWGFSRQENWSGLPCPPPEDLYDPGIESMSPVDIAFQVDPLPLNHQGSFLGSFSDPYSEVSRLISETEEAHFA